MRKVTKSNEGMALITVVIGVMFCLLLSSTMLRVALLGYNSRQINNQVSDTNYSAESVVDGIRLTLQNTAAKAWAETTNSSGDSSNFVKKTYEFITGSTYSSSNGSLNPTVKRAIVAKLQDNVLEGGTVLGIGEVSITSSESQNDTLIISDVEVEYTDPKTGMVSYVKTDIQINAPKYASSESVPLASYSMFAGSGCTSWNTNSEANMVNENQMGYFEQSGNVYVGYSTWHNDKDADSIIISNFETFIFSGDNVVINGNVIVKGYSCFQITGKNVEVRGKILLGKNCHLIISKDTNLQCQDIRFFDNDSDVSATNTNYKSVAKKTYKKSADKVSYEGLPLDHKATKAKNPYVQREHSIVYVDGNGDGYDCDVAGGTVADKDKRAFSGTAGVHCNETDTNLYPVKNIVHNGKEYDSHFAEVIDLDYWEKFCSYEGPKNDHLEAMLKTGCYKKAGNKYEVTNYSFDASNVKSGAKFNYAEGKSETFKIEFDTRTTSRPNHLNDKIFLVCNRDAELHLDADGDYYGIVITPKRVLFKKDGGYTNAKSLLMMDTSSDKHNLKSFIDNVGLQISDTTESMIGGNINNVKYVIFNNLFVNGIKCFYDGGTGNNAELSSADEEYNNTLRLIEYKNYDRH